MTESTTAVERARIHHARIEANVDDFLARRIDRQSFGRRALALHAAARTDGPAVDAALVDLIVARLPKMIREEGS
jgi:hypothetical protein